MFTGLLLLLFFIFIVVKLCFIDGLRSNRSSLFFKYSIDFNLSPYKIALISIFRTNPPIPSFEESLNHSRVVTWSNIIFNSFGLVTDILIFQIQVNVDIVCKLYLKQQI